MPCHIEDPLTTCATMPGGRLPKMYDDTVGEGVPGRAYRYRAIAWVPGSP